MENQESDRGSSSADGSESQVILQISDQNPYRHVDSGHAAGKRLSAANRDKRTARCVLAYLPIGELTDHQKARIFVASGLSKRIRFTKGGAYYRYRNGVWQYQKNRDECLTESSSLVEFYENASESTKIAEEREIALQNARKSENIAVFRTFLNAIRTEPTMELEADMLDQRHDLLNTASRTIDLEQGEPRAFSPHDFLTRRAKVEFDPRAKCPIWEKFVAETQDNDKERIEYLRRAVGYSLSGRTHEQALFYLIGEPGTGKSTFMRILVELLGEYATVAPTSLIYRKNKDVSTTLGLFRNKRLVHIAEVEKDQKIGEGLLKQLTGDDPVVSKLLYKDSQMTKPTWKLWISANQSLRLDDKNSGLFRRLHPIEFNKGANSRDPLLASKLENELPGILNWALRGHKEYRAQGLARTTHAENLIIRHRILINPIASFIESRTVRSPSYSVGSTALYSSYREFAREFGSDIVSQKEFSMRVSGQPNVTSKKRNGNNVFVGLRLK